MKSFEELKIRVAKSILRGYIDLLSRNGKVTVSTKKGIDTVVTKERAFEVICKEPSVFFLVPFSRSQK